MAQMTTAERDAFLARTRLAILLTNRPDGTPDGIPVWFDWDGETVRFFSGAGAPKIERLSADPRVGLLVCNDVDEPPAWVRFEGRAVIDMDADAKALAVDVLAPRYWDLDVPAYAEVVKQWADAPSDAFVVVRVTPEHIRSSAG